MTALPATVSNLDLATVVEVLARHGCNVTDASQDLGVPASDLRRLMWSNPKLQDEAFEVVEARLDNAEKNVAEALNSDDSRRRDAAAFFVLRNTARARKRGWTTSSSSAAVDVNINQSRSTVFTWRPLPSELGTAEAVKQEEHRLAEVACAEAEGHQVVTLGWGDPDELDDDGGKVIEHEAGPEPSSKD